MDKRTLNYLTVFEVAVFFLTLTGMVFVPNSMIPQPVWPLLLGFSYLGVVAWLTIRTGSLAKGRMGELMGGAFFTTLGIILFSYPKRVNLAFGISLAVTVLVGVLWASWNAWKEGRASEEDQEP